MQNMWRQFVQKTHRRAAGGQSGLRNDELGSPFTWSAHQHNKHTTQPNTKDPSLVVNQRPPPKGDSSQQPSCCWSNTVKSDWCGFSHHHTAAFRVCEWAAGSLHSSKSTEQARVSQLSVPTGDCSLCATETACRRRASPPLVGLMVKRPSCLSDSLATRCCLCNACMTSLSTQKMLLWFVSPSTPAAPQNATGNAGRHLLQCAELFPGFPSKRTPAPQTVFVFNVVCSVHYCRSSPLWPHVKAPPTVNYPFSRSTFARLSCFPSFPDFPTHFTTSWNAGSSRSDPDSLG